MLTRAILSLPDSIYPCFCIEIVNIEKITIWWGISSFCFAVSSTFAFHSTSAVTSSAATCSVPLADHPSPSCDHHSLTRPLALVRSGVLEADHKHNCITACPIAYPRFTLIVSQNRLLPTKPGLRDYVSLTFYFRHFYSFLGLYRKVVLPAFLFLDLSVLLAPYGQYSLPPFRPNTFPHRASPISLHVVHWWAWPRCDKHVTCSDCENKASKRERVGRK